MRFFLVRKRGCTINSQTRIPMERGIGDWCLRTPTISKRWHLALRDSTHKLNKWTYNIFSCTECNERLKRVKSQEKRCEEEVVLLARLIYLHGIRSSLYRHDFSLDIIILLFLIRPRVVSHTRRLFYRMYTPFPSRLLSFGACCFWRRCFFRRPPYQPFTWCGNDRYF